MTKVFQPWIRVKLKFEKFRSMFDVRFHRSWTLCNGLLVSKKVSKCRFLEHDYVTLRMSSEHIRLQVSPKLFRINSWIPQMIRQWIPDCWCGNRKCTGPKGAAANSRNWQLMTSGRSQMLATSNFRDWHTVVSRRDTLELTAEDNDIRASYLPGYCHNLKGGVLNKAWDVHGGC